MKKLLNVIAVSAPVILTPIVPAAAASWVIDSQDVLGFGLGAATTGSIDISGLNGNVDGPSVTVSASGGLTLQRKSIPSLSRSALFETDGGSISKVLGTSAPPTGEINNEGLTFDFSNQVFLNQLTVAHLYPAGEHNDSFGEVGVIEVTRANLSIDSFYLRPDSETTASLYSSLSFTSADLVPLVTVVNLQPAIDGQNDGSDGPGDIVVEKSSQGGPGNQGGVWQILGDNLFGDFVSMTLRGLDQDNIGGNTGDSDFSFVAAGGAISAVPLPPSLAIFLSALVGLGFLSRKRSENQAL
ncbi:hypothetical protein [Hwanghaeella sp.]|uniref:hypothetical protein n=1 Tax=Hwanghaeella sp. TaxID=2605943 RepID=UPI003CCBB90F